MGKSKKDREGFSADKPAPIQGQRDSEAPAADTAKEQEAAALINQGKLQEAEAIYRELIKEGTRNHLVYGHLAALSGMQGRFDELIALLKRALELNPNYAEAHSNLAIALQEQGDLNAAIASYKKAIELKPDYPNALNNLRLALQQQGVLKEQQAEALIQQGKLEQAEAIYRELIKEGTINHRAYGNLAAICGMQGRFEELIELLNKALELNPNYPHAYNILGVALDEQGDHKAAVSAYNKALELKPNYPVAHYNLGNALKAQGELEAAIAAYQESLRLKPNHADAYYNLGLTLQEQGDLNTAIDCYNKALDLQPNFPEANWNCSLSLLLAGDYRKGLAKYEWRNKVKTTTQKPHAKPRCPPWDGSPSDPGRPILLVSEQGLGDTLQFMRYVIALRERGATVRICAQPELHTLIQASGIDASPLTALQADQVKAGTWAPLLSVPHYLDVRPDNPIINQPYIKTTNELSSRWQSILSREQQAIIAINWQGNPKSENTGLRGRSLPLEAFAPLTTLKPIALLSLQKGFGSEQLATCSFRDRFVGCQAEVDQTWDFLETAAIIDNCDLIITSDTAVAHLAGGMGKKTWLLLHHIPDWRWGLEGETSFWYPSMRLFRQRSRGDWQEVMQRVAEALRKEFAEIAADDPTHRQPRQPEAPTA